MNQADICMYATRAAEKLRGEHQYCRMSALGSKPAHSPSMSNTTATLPA